MVFSSKAAARRSVSAVAIATALVSSAAFGSITTQDQTTTRLGVDISTPLADAADGVTSREPAFVTNSDIKARLGVTLLVPDVSDVFVAIFDNMGVPVTSFAHTYGMHELRDQERIADGRWRLDVEWNGYAANGIAAPNGVYIWKIVVKSRNGETIETTRKLGLR